MTDINFIENILYKIEPIFSKLNETGSVMEIYDKGYMIKEKNEDISFYGHRLNPDIFGDNALILLKNTLNEFQITKNQLKLVINRKIKNSTVNNEDFDEFLKNEYKISDYNLILKYLEKV